MKKQYKRTKYVPRPVLAYFPTKHKIKINKWELLREMAKEYPPNVSKRLEWIIFYETIANHDATYTSKYFGISRKTFHKWYGRFKKSKHSLRSLKNLSRAPHHTRRWEVSYEQEDRIISLRKNTKMIYGKSKLKTLYQQLYNEQISTWKIERVIRKHNLFKNTPNHKKRTKSIARAKKPPRKRIQHIDLKKIHTFGYLWRIDCIILNWYGTRRVIVTAVEHMSRAAYARIYPSNKSAYMRDFLNRLMYLASGNVQIMHSDNGSEFELMFKKQCDTLGIKQVFSRPHTPKDNPMVERFNRTLQEEWLEISDVDLEDICIANTKLTTWLKEYNAYRPHASLDYLTPLAYAEQVSISNPEVLPMYPARTVLYNI